MSFSGQQLNYSDPSVKLARMIKSGEIVSNVKTGCSDQSKSFNVTGDAILLELIDEAPRFDKIQSVKLHIDGKESLLDAPDHMVKGERPRSMFGKVIAIGRRVEDVAIDDIVVTGIDQGECWVFNTKCYKRIDQNKNPFVIVNDLMTARSAKRV